VARTLSGPQWRPVSSLLLGWAKLRSGSQWKSRGHGPGQWGTSKKSKLEREGEDQHERRRIDEEGRCWDWG
jgi:hypothetical protein